MTCFEGATGHLPLASSSPILHCARNTDALEAPLASYTMTTDVNSFFDDIDPTVLVDGDGRAYLYGQHQPEG